MRALDTGIFSEMVVDTISDAAGRDQFVQAIKDLGGAIRCRASLTQCDATRRSRTTCCSALRAALFLLLGVGSYLMTGAASLDSAPVSDVPTLTR